jgi:hypothetical protein
VIAIAWVAVGGAQSTQPSDVRFGHIICTSLTVRSDAAGGSLQASCDKVGASLRLAGPGAATTIGVDAQKDNATVFLSKLNAKGIPNAALTVDSESGAVSLGNSSGKSKEIEPE